MKTIALLILSAMSCLGQPFTMQDQAFMQAAIPAAAAAPTYLIDENWEGDDSGSWSVQNDAAALNMDNTTNVLVGSESLAALASGAAPCYVYNTVAFADQADVYVYFLFKLTKNVSAGYTRAAGWITNAGGDHHLTMQIYGVDATTFKFRVDAGYSGGTQIETTSTVGATNAVWLRYQQGSGANGRSDLWFAPYYAAGDAVKPANGSSYHAYRDDSAYTTPSVKVQLGTELSGGTGPNVIYDELHVSSSPIGNNP